MVDMKVEVQAPPFELNRFKTVLYEQASICRETAQIYPCTPQGNKAFQQYLGLLNVIRLCGLYPEFEKVGGTV